VASNGAGKPSEQNTLGLVYVLVTSRVMMRPSTILVVVGLAVLPQARAFAAREAAPLMNREAASRVATSDPHALRIRAVLRAAKVPAGQGMQLFDIGANEHIVMTAEGIERGETTRHVVKEPVLLWHKQVDTITRTLRPVRDGDFEHWGISEDALAERVWLRSWNIERNGFHGPDFAVGTTAAPDDPNENDDD
jgi:hypothetical protein